MRNRLNVRLSPETLQQIADFASRKKLSQSAIVEAAIISFLSPDGADRREAAFTRRLDRLIRQILRLERNTGVTMEMLAVFARFLLTITPTLPPDLQAAAQAKGQQRYGQVASLAPATGAQFSVIPPENATGNFTKIVQRVPVRILLEDNAAELGRLRPGLSVIARVDTRESTGVPVDERKDTPVRSEERQDSPGRENERQGAPVRHARQ
jgi:hypothetical protein